MTVASVMVSLTCAVAVPVPTTRCSKLPPEVPVMVAVRLEASLIDVLAVARAIISVPVVCAIRNRDVALVGVDRGDALRGVRQRRREHVVRDRALDTPSRRSG